MFYYWSVVRFLLEEFSGSLKLTLLVTLIVVFTVVRVWIQESLLFDVFDSRVESTHVIDFTPNQIL